MKKPTITELRKIARYRSSILRDSEKGLITKAKSQEKKLNRYVSDSLIGSLQIDSNTNTIRNTSANLRRVNTAKGLKRFIKNVVNVFMNDYYLNSFSNLTGQTNKYFDKFNPTDGSVKRINNKGTITVDGFLNNLFDNNQISRSIQNTIRKSISSKDSISKLKETIEGQIKGKENKLGLVSSYHYREGYNQFQEYSRGLDDDFSTILNLNYAIYAGGEIKSTRLFCEERNGNVYNRETILSWNDSPSYWQGRKSDNNILIDMGGHYCRHDFDWISYELAKRLDSSIEKSKFDK